MKRGLTALLQANMKDAPQRIQAQISAVNADITDIYVYDVIDADWGASAKDLISAISGTRTSTIHLHINSPGGDVFEARAMISALRTYSGKVVSYIDGVAASAASYLALAADEVNMTDGAFFMIHKAWSFAMGNADELTATADLLNKVDGTIAADYAKKTGNTPEAMLALMAAETWFTASEAKSAGFIDAVVGEGESPANRKHFDVSAYANVPDQLKKGRDSPNIENEGQQIDVQAQQHWEDLNRRASLYQLTS